MKLKKSHNRSDRGDLSQKILKFDSVPTLFPDCPVHMTIHQLPTRSNAAIVSERFQCKENILEEHIEAFWSSENVSSVQQIKDKSSCESLPSGFLMN